MLLSLVIFNLSFILLTFHFNLYAKFLANTAAGAAAAAAVVRQFAALCFFILIAQKGARYRRLNMFPRKYFIFAALAGNVKFFIKPAVLQGLQPAFIIKLFAPAVKFGSALPCKI